MTHNAIMTPALQTCIRLAGGLQARLTGSTGPMDVYRLGRRWPWQGVTETPLGKRKG